MRAAIYTRLSLDRFGDELGVKRQEDMCRKKALELGLHDVEVFCDNDISAAKRKRRPAYLAMCHRIRQGDFQALITYHPDRLTRHMKELEELIELIEECQVTVYTVAAGHYDLSTASGRMVARVLGSVARAESERIGERRKAQLYQSVKLGKPINGGRRPFGWAEDRVTPIPHEQALLREAADRALAGEAFTSIARDFTERGVKSVTGGRFTSATLSCIFKKPRIIGKIVYEDLVVDAPWEPVISAEEQTEILAILELRKAASATGARKHLLSGLLTCTRCGETNTRAKTTRHKTVRYTCDTCYASILGTLADQQAYDAVRAMLVADGPLVDVTTQADVASELERLHQARHDLHKARYVSGELTEPEYRTLLDELQARVDTLTRRYAGVSFARTLDGEQLDAETLPKLWEAKGLTWRRKVLVALFRQISFTAATKTADGVAKLCFETYHADQ